MPRARSASTIGVLSVLALAIVLPVLVSGFAALGEGAAAVRSGDYLKAAEYYESAAHKLPWRHGLWESAGLAASASGDALRAIELLESGRRADGLSATGWEILGSALWDSGAPSEAIATWRSAAALYPREAALLDRLAGGYHELGDYSAEQAALERRLQVQDDAAARYRLALLLTLSDPQGARRMLDEAAAMNSDIGPVAATLKAAMDKAEAEEASQALVVIGRSLGLVEEWGLARRAFSFAVEADPANAEARAWLGEAHQHLGGDGRADLDAALSIGRNNSVVHTLRGLYWRRQGNLGLSLAEYTRASELEPESAALRSLVGEAYAANGDLVAALEAYETAVELAPTESTYWRLLALFSADYEVQVIEVGVAAGMKAAELSPEDPQALDALGWALAQGGYLFRAEEALLRATELSPGFASAHLHLGLTYMRWGQNDKAYQYLTKTVELDGHGASGQYAAQILRTYFAAQ